MASARLASLPAPLFSGYCIAAAFLTYFSMYAFRKPFTATTYEEHELWGIALKTILLTSQVLGYCCSKFLGIKWVSEARPDSRAVMILLLIAISELALIGFAVLPLEAKFICLFLNGLPLGMVFGLVLGFLEGRRFTELLTAGLCSSFIVSSGVVKSVGSGLIEHAQVAEFWMPALTGIIFVPPLLLGVWMLHQIPPPTQQDELLRSRRPPSFLADRRRVIQRHRFGLSMLVISYVMLTVLRSFRDDFAVEIWEALGTRGKPAIFTVSETVVMLLVTIINGAAFLVHDNRRAFYTALFAIAGGFATTMAVSVLFLAGSLSSLSFMVGLGVGMYVPYVAYHTTLFERMIAVFRERTNLAHLMYVADSFGYLGYILILFLRHFATGPSSFLQWMVYGTLLLGGMALILTTFSMIYFYKQMQGLPLGEPTTSA